MDLHVVSAAMHEQNMADAPGDVTVITREEIRKWGYRTLADALSYVRGFFLTSDRSYNYLGIRGFALPGDYETRLVMMLNGHSLTENTYDAASWFGNDFPVDIDLIDRIEVVRGPSSALYGTNGILATINVVTKRPATMQGTSVRIDTGSLGGRQIVVTESLPLGKGSLLLSGSLFNNAGAHSIYFPEFDTPETNGGRAINVDGEKGYHMFADFTRGNWEVLAVASDRVKIQPLSWGETVFNDRGTRAEDSRGLVDVSYTKDLAGDRTLSWRTFYDSYRYRGIYHYVTSSGTDDNRERDYGDWVGSKFSYRMPDWHSGHLTLGTETRIDLRSMQNVFDVQPVKRDILLINRADRYVGAFAQQEWALGRKWELNLGGRFDFSWLKRDAFAPRASLVFKPDNKHVFKFLYGRGFRNPSNYEMFFDDNGLSIRANPGIRAETTDTFEIDAESKLSKRVQATASAYHYTINDLIQQTYDTDGLAQYVNADRVRAAGASLGLNCELPRGMQLSSALEFQRAVLADSTQPLANSPGQVGKLRFSMPLWRNAFTFSTGLQALGQRQTYDGTTVPWVILPEAVIGTRSFHSGFQLTGGVKNLSNSHYRDPIGLVAGVPSIQGARRTFFLTMRWESRRAEQPSTSDAHQLRNASAPALGEREARP